MIRRLSRTGRGLRSLALLAAGALLVTVLLVLRQTSGSGPRPPRAGYQDLYQAGLARLEAGYYFAAVEPLERATRIDPRQPMGHYLLAQAYFRSAQLVEALDAIGLVLEDPDLRRYAEARPDSYRFYVLRGDIAYGLSDYKLSKSDFSKAIKLRPDVGELHHMLSQIHVALLEPEEALGAGLEALRLGHRTFESTYKVGLLYKRLERLEEAEPKFRASIRLSPGYTPAYYNLAQTLVKMGKKEEGRRTYKIANKLAQVDDQIQIAHEKIAGGDPSDEGYREGMEKFGAYCSEYFKYAELKQCMSQLLSVYPDSAEYHTIIGSCRANLGEEIAAERHFRHALKIEPGSVGAMNGLALLLAGARDRNTRRPVEALIWAERARGTGYHGDEVLAVALDASGQTEKARRLAPWITEEGLAWEAFHRRQIEEFQESVLEDEIRHLFPR